MEEPAEKKSRTDEMENTAVVLYGVDDLRIVRLYYCYAPIVAKFVVRLPLSSPTQPKLLLTSGSA